ncbi:MAG: DNA-protecting protein DprA [Candidatus Moranbacteria bacterium]|nr:DNA-protecting protein DprA [Candidatus Moranbacteria bacterium]
MEENRIKKISLESPDFPKRLKKIKHSPKELYYRGKLEVLNSEHILAVVGSRKITNYGKQVLRSLISEIAKRNVTIVSGLAFGVDILAHKLTLENGGKAVAVLAGGLDSIYPSEHTLYAEKIIETGGLLISENCPGTKYLKQYFPARNRIISGLSDAVLLVEAKNKSGALITAKFAFSQNRKVLAVPGSIFSEQSQGINNLFNKGAIPVQIAEDVLSVVFGWKRRMKKKRQGNVNLKILANLSAEEKIILESIPFDNPMTVNLIIRHTKLPPARVIAILTQLEINNLIESERSSGYIRI